MKYDHNNGKTVTKVDGEAKLPFEGGSTRNCGDGHRQSFLTLCCGMLLNCSRASAW